VEVGRSKSVRGSQRNPGGVFFGPLLGSSVEKVLGEKKVGLELGWWVGGWVKIVFIRV
jgi:hypothetical protein